MFGKKKKKNIASDDALKDEAKVPKKGKKDKMDSTSGVSGDDAKKKKRFSLKKILFILLFLGAVGVAVAVVYRIYFVKDENAYAKKELEHVTLGDEIMRFTYDLLPEIYEILLNFNKEVILLNGEIQRIKAIGDAYPDQIKIAEKELKIWEKTKTSMLKSFTKIEQQVESLYVLYRINNEQGLAQIKEMQKDIIQSAREALVPSLELTKRLKIVPVENIPQGFIKGNIYKIKKKALSFFD